MKLANLLEQHQTYSAAPGALKNSFGDGFLLTKNRIYKNVRTLAAANDFRFSSAQNDAYRVLPLSQLDDVLKTKTIPYFDNVSVLESLEQKIPRETVWDDISDNLKGNAVFHEACHAVARSLTNGFAAKLSRETKIDPPQSKTLAMLLEESFANTCELLSIIDADDQSHRIFLELNSYIYMLGDRVHLRNAREMMGAPALGKFILLTYLYANFLRDFNEQTFMRSVRLATGEDAPVDAKNLKSLRQLSKIAFQLNPRFREVTTRFYLRLNGIKTDVLQLQSFDFLKALERSETASEFLSGASGVF